MPAALATGDPGAERPFDGVLDWEVGGPADRREFFDGVVEMEGGHYHRFSSEGKALGRYDRDLFLCRLPEGARVLVRISLHERVFARGRRGELAESIRAVWEGWIGEDLRRGKLKAVLTATPSLAKALRAAHGRDVLRIGWNNYHGPTTPHEEVLYTANDRFVGRGDAGFAGILAEVGKLPPDAKVILPRYQLGGRAAIETFSRKEIDARNAGLRDLAPFDARRRELVDAITGRGLEMTVQDGRPGGTGGTVKDWSSGDRFGQTFVSSGRILRHDEERGPAAARLGWSRYEIGGRDKERQVETAASYTVDGAEVGRGVAGFARAMERLAALPEGSVVQVDVCLSTRPPFVCPIIYEGHRHFERTGFEPYFGMFPWLVDVARKGKLEIQWVPDENESCQDCELNK
jgi:hypothetical protein